MGSKTHLAEALAHHELRAFLAEVVAGFGAEPADPVRAVRSSVLSVLQYAKGSPLIRAIVSSAMSVIVPSKPIIRPGLKAGWVRRRSRSQNSPPLINKPSPSRSSIPPVRIDSGFR